MIYLTRTLTITTAACAFTLTGCDNSSHTHTNGSSTVEADHDDSGHSHGGNAHDLGTVEIGGSELSVSMSGSVSPNTQLHVDVTHAGGPIPVEIRLWVGVKSGEGSLKSKADGNGGHWHGHVECPKSIDSDTKLWIEAESTDGTRTAKALPLS